MQFVPIFYQQWHLILKTNASLCNCIHFFSKKLKICYIFFVHWLRKNIWFSSTHTFIHLFAEHTIISRHTVELHKPSAIFFLRIISSILRVCFQMKQAVIFLLIFESRFQLHINCIHKTDAENGLWNLKKNFIQPQPPKQTSLTVKTTHTVL